MSYETCPLANDQCKYWNRKTPAPLRKEQKHGCFSDLDHISPQRFGKTPLASAYIQLQINKQQLCRRIHEEKTRAGDEPLPTIQTMVEAICAAEAAGECSPNGQVRRMMKRLGQCAAEATQIVPCDDLLAPTFLDDGAGNHLEA